MKGTRYKNTCVIKAVIATVVNELPKQELKKFFEMFITRFQHCIVVDFVAYLE